MDIRRPLGSTYPSLVDTLEPYAEHRWTRHEQSALQRKLKREFLLMPSDSLRRADPAEGRQFAKVTECAGSFHTESKDSITQSTSRL